MRKMFSKQMQKCCDFVSELRFTSGIAVVVVVSCILSIGTNYLNISGDLLSLESSVFLSGHIHKLLTYSFYHRDVGHLLLSVAMLVLFCSGVENGVGTVRFLHHLLLFSTCVGMEHVLLELLLFSPSARSSVSGLIPVSLAVLGMVTISSRMRKAVLLGVNVPTATLPWILLLFVTLITPNTAFLCNVLAVGTGELYGMRWFSVLEMSESKACVLEKKMPFRWLKKMAGVQYIPASAEERRKDLHTICSPPPGSYPVQTYAPALPSALLPNSLEGWSHFTSIQQNYMGPPLGTGFGTGHHELRHGHGHACGDGHACGHGHACGDGHGLHQSAPQASSPWTAEAPYVLSNFRTVNTTGQTLAHLPEAPSQAPVQVPLTGSLADPPTLHPTLSP